MGDVAGREVCRGAGTSTKHHERTRRPRAEARDATSATTPTARGEATGETESAEILRTVPVVSGSKHPAVMSGERAERSTSELAAEEQQQVYKSCPPYCYEIVRTLE